MKKIEYLAWDSEFFNKKIGRIIVGNSENIVNILEEAKKEDYQLIYAFGNEDFYVKKEILQQYNGKLVDEKLLYYKLISEPYPFLEQIEDYTDTLTEELENLAYISGEFSRFKSDKNFAEDDFYRMYKIWIEKSLDRKIADYVFVAKESEQLQGMVTLKIFEKTGHIGLIAVSPETQRKGYGKILIKACENELFAKDIFQLEVPTQKDNTQACKFYEKYGFKIKEITNIYHFWL